MLTHRNHYLMNQLSEGLRPNDLKDLVKNVFEIDTFKSKMGDDENIVVVSFDVTGNEAAKDLVNFIEKSYDVLDADVSSGEVKKGVFKVFVELERNNKVVRQIEDIIYGLSNLTGSSDWRFRYYKNYQSQPLEDLSGTVPNSAQAYRSKIESVFENDLRFFFRRSPLDYMIMEDNTITFKRIFNSPVKMELVSYGTRTEILTDLAGTIRIDETSMGETLWLTKYFGDFNITKYDEHFVFENDNNVLVFKLTK